MKIKLIVLGLIVFLIGFLVALLMMGTYNSGVYQAVELSVYACHDGCSIATKDSEGFLTNVTWDCWEECNKYIGRLIKEVCN